MDKKFDMLGAIEKHLGLDTTMHLVAHYGGQRIKVPKKVEGSSLSKALGVDLAQWMVDEFAGMNVAIPNGHKYRVKRVKKIVLANDASSANALAKRLGLTARRIEQIRQEARHEKQLA